MATRKQLAANRRNAQRSTGPRTEQGKATSRFNAVRHGLRAESPVVPGLESHEEWEAHRDALQTSLRPVGALEQLLVERIVVLSWRLRRVPRYERNLIKENYRQAEHTDGMEATAEAVADIPDVGQIVDDLRKAVVLVGGLGTFPGDQALPGRYVAPIVELVAARLHLEDREGLRRLGLAPPGVTFDPCEGWTCGKLKALLSGFGSRVSLPGRDARGWLQRELELQASRVAAAAPAIETDRELSVGQPRRQPPLLAEITRYESHLHRCLFQSLHELERAQARRLGSGVAPPAIVDVVLSDAGAGMVER